MSCLSGGRRAGSGWASHVENNKQLLDKATSDIEIYSGETSIIRRGEAESDNSLARLNKSRYPILPRPIIVLSSTQKLFPSHAKGIEASLFPLKL